MSAILDIKQRDEELYQAYRKAFRQPGMTHRKAIQQAIHTQTSRYWVSTSWVYRYLLARKQGKPNKYAPNNPHPCRKDMYEELYRIYQRLTKERYLHGYSTYFITSFVINRPAPRFYIDFRRAQLIIAKKRKEAHLRQLEELKARRLHLPFF